MCGPKITSSVRRRSFLPYYICHKISLTKYLITNFSKVLDFMVINGHENYPIRTQKIACNQ